MIEIFLMVSISVLVLPFAVPRDRRQVEMIIQHPFVSDDNR